MLISRSAGGDCRGPIEVEAAPFDSDADDAYSIITSSTSEKKEEADTDDHVTANHNCLVLGAVVERVKIYTKKKRRD